MATPAQTPTVAPDGGMIEGTYDQRDETPLQKLDRNTAELVGELDQAPPAYEILQRKERGVIKILLSP